MIPPPPRSPVTALTVEDREGTRLLTITVPRLVVRAAVILPIAIAVAALEVAAPQAPLWPGLVLVVLAVVSAELPDSGTGIITLTGLAGWWLVAVTDPFTPWALLVAACVLAFHVSVAHAAAGPSGCAPTRAVVLRLSLRCGVVLGATCLVALVVVGVDESAESPPALVGITLVLLGLLPWIASRR